MQCDPTVPHVDLEAEVPPAPHNTYIHSHTGPEVTGLWQLAQGSIGQSHWHSWPCSFLLLSPPPMLPPSRKPFWTAAWHLQADPTLPSYDPDFGPRV